MVQVARSCVLNASELAVSQTGYIIGGVVPSLKAYAEVRNRIENSSVA